MSTEEDTAIKRMTTQNVIISPLILSHYIKPRTERQRLIYHQTCPWGIYAATRPRVWPWLLHAASLSLPQFKTRGWEDHSSLTQFSQFSAQLWRRTYESTLLCDFERPCACWISLTDGSVSRADCCSRRWRKQEGKWQKWSLYSRFQNLERFRQLDFQHTCQYHLDTQHPVFVYSIWVHACCVYDLTCCQRSAVFTSEEEEFETQKYTKPNQTEWVHENMNHYVIMSRFICWSFPLLNMPLFVCD